MIDRAIVFLRDHLNAHLAPLAEDSSEAPEEEIHAPAVGFVDGDRMEPIAFKMGAVTLLLINVEEERSVRPADLHRRSNANGVQQKIHPEIQLNLYVLFVARFAQYEQSWAQLSAIVSHFQSQPSVDSASNPNLPEEIERLTFELQTLAFAEQNEVWASLRTTHQPSVLYKVRAVSFFDERHRQARRVREHVEKIEHVR